MDLGFRNRILNLVLSHFPTPETLQNGCGACTWPILITRNDADKFGTRWWFYRPDLDQWMGILALGTCTMKISGIVSRGCKEEIQGSFQLNWWCFRARLARRDTMVPATHLFREVQLSKFITFRFSIISKPWVGRLSYATQLGFGWRDSQKVSSLAIILMVRHFFPGSWYK